MRRILVLFVGLALSSGASPGNDVSGFLAELGQGAETELRTGLLPFWLNHSRAKERGGFYGEVRADLQPVADAPRGALMTCRVLWTFSAAHRRFGDPAYREMAVWACEDLRKNFLDPRHGGLFWTITADGRPLDRRKHLYAQAFGIYALSEYHRMSGDVRAGEEAIALYRRIEAHARDREHGGYFEELDQTWRRADLKGAARGRLMGGGDAPKSQNAHLHLMEAYTNLLRIWPDAGLRRDLHAVAELMLARALDPDTHHLRLFFAADWTPRSDGISYGHDIEFSWLIGETAAVLGDPDLMARAREEAVAIADACLREGVDADGGVFYESGPEGIRNGRKEWWPQAEAVVGFLNAWQLSGDARFLKAARHTWSFIESRLVNRNGGEWLRSTDRQGRPDRTTPLANLWKGPYHNGRACLEIIARVEAARQKNEASAR